MEIADSLSPRASELVEAARRFQSAAAQPGCHIDAPDALVSLEEALQVLSAACYQLAADASPGIVERRRDRGSEAPSPARGRGLSREQEVLLMGTLHDVAAGFARCARACREGRSTVTPITADVWLPARWTIAAVATSSLLSKGTTDRGSASRDRPPMNAGIRRRELPRTPRCRGLLLGGIWLRCTTRWSARELDRQLAAGADPMQSDDLSLRVGQLGSSRSRRRIACALRGAVALAERDAYPVMVAAPQIQRAAVRASGGLLLEIADRLHSCDPVGVRGLAIASQLIEDRRGPLYRDNAERPLSVTAFEALVALDRGLRTINAPDC